MNPSRSIEAIFKNSPLGVVLFAFTMQKETAKKKCFISESNEIFKQLSGYYNEKISASLSESGISKDLEILFCEYELNELLKKGESKQAEYVSEFNHRKYLVNIYSPDQEHVVATFTDIGEFVPNIQELTSNAKRYEALLESQNDLIVRVDTQNLFTYVNDAYCRTFGKRKEELLGKSFYPLIHEEDRDSTQAEMAKLSKPPYSCYIEQRALTVNGWRWIAWEDKAIFDDNGAIIEIQGVGRDITIQKEKIESVKKSLESDLVERENKLNSIIEAMPDMIIIMHREGTVLEIHGAIEENLTSPTESLIGCSIKQVFSEIEFKRHTDLYKHCIETGEIGAIKFTLEINKKIKVFESRIKALDNERLLTVVRDVSIENELIKEQLHRSFIFENDRNGLVVFDTNHCIIDVNSTFCNMIGYSADELKKMHAWDFDTLMTEEQVRNNFKDQQDINVLFESVHRRKDGSLYDVEVSAVAFQFEGEKLIYCSARDITERKEAEDRLKRSEEKYRMLFNANKDSISIFYLEEDGNLSKFVEMNDAGAAIIGYSQEELLGMHLSDIEIEVDDEDRTKRIHDILNHGHASFETLLRNKSGEKRILEVKAILIEYNSRPALLNIARDITERKEKEAEIKRFKEIVEKAVYGMVIANKEGIIEYVNPFFANVHGYKIHELHGKHFSIFHTAEQMEKVRELTKEGSFDPVLNWHVHKNGTEFPMLMSGLAIKDHNDEIQYLVATAIDRTEHYKNEVALEEARLQFKHLSDNLPLGAVYQIKSDVYNQKRECMFISNSIERISGYTASEIMSDVSLMYQLILPEDASRVVEKEAIAHETMSIFKDEIRIRNKEGQIRWLVIASSPRLIGKDEIIWDGVMVDVTDYNKTKEKLQESDERFTQIATHNQSIIWEIDMNGLYTYVSPMSEAVWGYKPEDMVGIMHYYNLHPEMGRDLFKQLTLQKIEQGEIIKDLENQVVRKDGHLIWVSTNGVPVYGKNMELIGYRGSDNDITDRKRAEAETNRFKKIAESANYGMAIANPMGNIEYINSFFAEIHGYTSTELIGKHISIFHSESQLTSVMKLFQEIAQNKKVEPTIVWHAHRNGTEFPMLMSGIFVQDNVNNQEYVAASAIDMTDYIKAEQQIRAQEARYRSIIALSNTGAWEFDINKNFVWCSPEYFSMLGYDVADFNMDGSDNLNEVWSDLIHPDDKENAQTKFLQYLMEENAGMYENYFRMKHKDGHDVWIWSRGQRIENQDGTRNNLVLGTHIDISDQQNYLRKIEGLLKTEEKQNQSLLSFTQIVSHNLRVHTANMLGIFMLLKSDHPELYDNEFLKMIETSSESLEETIRDLNDILSMKHVSPDEYKSVNLYSFMEEQKILVLHAANAKQVRVFNEVAKHETVDTIPESLQRIVFNLLTNAIQFSSTEKESFIKIKAEKNEKYLAISLEDNGIGIDLNRHGSKLFDMYKKFHEGYDSKGLGLYIVKNQVEALGGYIEVQSEINKGSIFTVYIPNEKI
jgi:PAS domain S-box-containing protein